MSNLGIAADLLPFNLTQDNLIKKSIILNLVLP